MSPDETGETIDGRGTMSVPSTLQIFVFLIYANILQKKRRFAALPVTYNP